MPNAHYGGLNPALGQYSGTGSSQGQAQGEATTSNGPIAQGILRGGIALGALVWTYKMIFASTGVPQVAPGFAVPAGSIVRVRAYNGLSTGNAGVVDIATDRNSLLAGLGAPMASLDDIAFPVDNTAKIWGSGTAGDGVVISVYAIN
jgi:hypothetical protein